MLELPLIFVGGFLGSAHCVGMCGGFALMIGAGASGFRANIGRQIVYSLGRIFTYSACGAALGYAGLRLAQDLPGVIHIQAALALAAGGLLVVQGLFSSGVLPRLHWSAPAAASATATRPSGELPGVILQAVGASCPAAGMLGPFLRAPGLGNVFLAGMLTGFLPCGLVYAYLALATSASNFVGGLATMAAFGLGTVPLMVLAGSGASLVSLAARQRLLKIAAWCVVLTGLVSLGRGMAFWNLPERSATPSCPMCAEAKTDY